MSRCRRVKIMGVLNVTPDSFSDGGQFYDVDAAVTQAAKMIKDGADILDIGGESTRPYSDPVSAEEEALRVLPVIHAIRKQFDTPISIDTSKASVAEKALEAGANIINDITALQKDPQMLPLVRSTDASIIIMHMQGTPKQMQMNPTYDNVLDEIIDFFNQRIQTITSAGIDKSRITIDPGIGFGKSVDHNLSILKHLKRLQCFDVPVLLAHSRKRFLGEISQIEKEADRDCVTAVVTALSASQEISIVRVHDVATTRQTLRVVNAIKNAL